MKGAQLSGEHSANKPIPPFPALLWPIGTSRLATTGLFVIFCQTDRHLRSLRTSTENRRRHTDLCCLVPNVTSRPRNISDLSRGEAHGRRGLAIRGGMGEDNLWDAPLPHAVHPISRKS